MIGSSPRMLKGVFALLDENDFGEPQLSQAPHRVIEQAFVESQTHTG